MKHLSIVSPVYMAEHTLKMLTERITLAVSKITTNFEIILVDDGSTDNSWIIIEELARTNKAIKGVKLSRNFGQHYAITAGLDQCTGEWVVVMDCDLQDLPEEIPALYQKSAEGFDMVLASRNNRKDSWIKRFQSALFYRVLGYLTGTRQDESVGNFGIYHRSVIDAIGEMRESIRYFPAMVKWVGFNSTKIDVEHALRQAGKTNYNFRKLALLALDIILSYSDKPLRMLIKAGFFVSFLSFVMGIVLLVMWSQGGIVVTGYTSLILSVWFFSGVIILTLGFVGLYVGKTFEGVRKRPIYLIEKTTS